MFASAVLKSNAYTALTPESAKAKISGVNESALTNKGDKAKAEIKQSFLSILCYPVFAEIRAQGFRYDDASVRLLIIFQYRRKSSADGDAAAV